MFYAETPTDEPPITLMPRDRQKCDFIAVIICLQCIAVWVGATSILTCIWTPEFSTDDYSKLTRIMYLYDSKACGYKLKMAKQITNLQLSNDTHGLNILPIKWLPAITSVSTRLSSKTRNITQMLPDRLCKIFAYIIPVNLVSLLATITLVPTGDKQYGVMFVLFYSLPQIVKRRAKSYITLSFTFHILWFILAFTFRIIIKNCSDLRTLKVTLAIFLYSCVFIVCFDLSMAVLYVTHIKQSLDKGMILRYSGWGNELKLDTYDDFAGWLPIVAAACWLRGVLIFMMNVYFCRALRLIRRKIQRKELYKNKFHNERYHHFPDSEQVKIADTNVLVYRVESKLLK